MAALAEPIGASAVHLCIDMQRIFAPGGIWATPWLPRVVPATRRLVERAPERTVFTRFVTPRNSSEAGGAWRRFYRKWEHVTRAQADGAIFDLVPELEAFAPPARLFDRYVFSAFADGRLHAQLREAGVDTLIVSGAETDVCVLSTVLSAVDLGYRVVLAQDALCSSSDESHDALVSLYGMRFDTQIELAEVALILDAWRPL